MHVGRSYRLLDFTLWSRRSVLYMLAISLVAVLVYIFPPTAGFAIPWPIVLVLGTTVSLVAGFKSSQVLQRSSDALQTFTGIAVTSRLLAGICCDFFAPELARRILYRHLAWLTAQRVTLRQPRPWESLERGANREYRRRYLIHDDPATLFADLDALVGPEAAEVIATGQPALALLERQGRDINAVLRDSAIPTQVFGELQKLLRECHDHQMRCDRIKDFPYPRQYAVVSAIFVRIFVTLLPFGVVPIFATMTTGVLAPVMLWLSVPFSALLGWAYMSLDQVTESTANPFEGSANDVPISTIGRNIEIELRQRLGETTLPPRLEPMHGIAT
jgi:putative membrane protein